MTQIITFSLETVFDGSMLLDKEILNWPPEHREIKINHQSVCVQIVLFSIYFFRKHREFYVPI